MIISPEYFKNCAYVNTEADIHTPLRFTKKQFKCYEGNNDRLIRAYSPAAVCLDFVTDATGFSMEYIFNGWARPYAFTDVYCNNCWTTSLESVKPTGTSRIEYSFSQKGTKRVTIYLPHIVRLSVTKMELHEATILKHPPKPGKTIFCFGDSITQGMDAKHPCSTIPVGLSRFFNAEVFNLGVGGYIFDKNMVDANFPAKPDLITVAYGTNDWATIKTVEQFDKNANDFWEELSKVYPDTPKVSITPFNRMDSNDKMAAGTLSEASMRLANIARKHGCKLIIDGMDISPAIANQYGDYYLHPSDEGFQRIILAICSKIVHNTN